MMTPKEQMVQEDHTKRIRVLEKDLIYNRDYCERLEILVKELAADNKNLKSEVNTLSDTVINLLKNCKCSGISMEEL